MYQLNHTMPYCKKQTILLNKMNENCKNYIYIVEKSL